MKFIRVKGYEKGLRKRVTGKGYGKELRKGLRKRVPRDQKKTALIRLLNFLLI